MDRVTKMAALLLGCSLATGAYADTAYDSRYFTLDLLAVQHDERFVGVDSELAAGARIGFGFPIGAIGSSRTSIETNLFFNPISFKGAFEANQMGVMADMVHAWDMGTFDPYLVAGLGVVEEEYDDSDSAQVHLAFEVGGGVAWQAFKDTALRAGITAQSVHNDQLPGSGDPYIDWRFNLGWAFPLGGRAAPAPAPAPAKVVDSDGDGLADAQDKCPTTPASTADGCPPAAPVVQTDSDGDGVYDSQDNCAGTLSGLKVDASGCAVQTEVQSVVLKGVTFLPGSATLTAEAKTVLDPAVAALTGQKTLKVELGGHTDSQGKDAFNLSLSQRRAESVRAYLVSKGVDAGQVTAKGYGETQPIADNNTAAGRAENRRVEFKVVK